MTMWNVPRETVEWVGPVTYTPADATLRLALIPKAARPAPADWQTPEVRDGKPGITINGPAVGVGEFHLWAELTRGPDTPVAARFAVVRVT